MSVIWESTLSPAEIEIDVLAGARVHVAAMCAGMLASSQKAALAYGETRHAFGQPLTSRQGLHWSLVDVAGALEALRVLAWQAGKLINEAENAVTAAARARRLAGRATVPDITAGIQTMGAEGLHGTCARPAPSLRQDRRLHRRQYRDDTELRTG